MMTFVTIKAAILMILQHFVTGRNQFLKIAIIYVNLFLVKLAKKAAIDLSLFLRIGETVWQNDTVFFCCKK